jgi:two-component system, OmpR family, sensor kinase
MHRRLFWRIYLMLLAGLVLVAVLGAGLWRLTHDPGPPPFTELASRVLGALLPPADAPDSVQADAVQRLAQAVDGEFALYAADGRRIAAFGAAAPEARFRFGGRPTWRLTLPDGRRLSARLRGDRYEWFGGLLAMLAGVALAVGLAAHPVVRRLVRRLERLRGGVEAWGSGALSARVAVEGRDEVAALAQSFNAAAARIEQLVGAHRSLLANASHELRSPLARLRVALEMQAERPSAERAGEIARNLAELDALIEEILLASRLDHLQRLERPESVDLLALAAEEAARVGATAEGRTAEVSGDPRLLRRLVRNLLENAARHGAPPAVVSVDAGAPGMVRLAVSDQGAGVPETERERVFEPFYRPAGAAEGAGGWGLGLALVRQIAARHGGTARCDGRVFVVELPGKLG